jgi:tetratricopeptide (TPR) repeat protein
MVRATALDLLQRYGTAGVSTMVEALRDPDPLVRATAVGGLDRMPPQLRLAAVAPLLTDPIHAVRLEAARVLASVSPKLFDTTQRQAFETALAEFKAAQNTMADTPGAHLNLGVLYTSLGQPDAAEQAYQKAIKLDPFFLPARFNLVHLYNQTGRNTSAEQVLRDGIARVPKEGELYYSLGLLLAESQRLDEAASTLAQATALLPDRPRVRYNYALVLQHLKRPADAEAAMRAAHQLDTRDPDIVYALVVLYMQQSQWERALPYAQKLLELAPGSPGPQQLLQHIQNAIGSGKRSPSPR